MKKKILISISSDHQVRNFVESNAFEEIEKHYEVFYLVAPKVSNPHIQFRWHKINHYRTLLRTMIREHVAYCSMKRYESRCSSFIIKYKHRFQIRSLKWKIFYSIFSLPIFFECLSFFIEKILVKPDLILKGLKKINPDLVIAVSAINDTFSIDVIKCAKFLKIPTLLLMFNWDNITSRGVIPVTPDFAGLWGEQTQQFMHDIHRVPKKNCFVLGSPQFEVYFNFKKNNNIRNMLNISDSKKIILFLGVSRFRNEEHLLGVLDQAIDQGKIAENYLVLYRPHPWQDWPLTEENFFQRNYLHILMDPQMIEHYKSKRNDKNYNPGSFIPDYDYYPSLLDVSTIALSSLSTMSIETMIMGVPLVLLSFPDITSSFSFDSLRKSAQHNCWGRFRNVLDCTNENDMIDMINRQLLIAENVEVKKELKEDVKFVVYYDSQKYSQRLYQCVKSIL